MSEKILIVEDNPRSMKLILMTLKSCGYSLLEAIDGEEALDITKKEQPHLIIMDIQLPKMDGLEVIRLLKRMPELNHIPIIAITAYAMKGDEEKIMEAGFDAYLSKPINTRELPRIIAEILKQRQRSHD